MKENPLPVKRSSLKKWFWILLVLNVLFISFSTYYLHPLTTGEIISLEIAGTEDRLNAILSDWEKVPGKLEKALDSVYLDFVFIFLYIPFLALACYYLPSINGSKLFIDAGKFFSWLLLGVFACELIENTGLIKILNGDYNPATIGLTHDTAVAKFTILIIVVLFVVFSPFLNIPGKQKYSPFFMKDGNTIL